MCARSGHLFCALVLLAPSGATAQQEGVLPPTLTSDRTGFANTTGVAARGHLTTEFGVEASLGEIPEGSFPNLSMRIGLFDWLEARVRGPQGLGVFEGAGPRFGVGDPWVGFKLGGRPAESLAMSVDWELSIPIATDGFGAPEATFFADLNVDWNFWGPLTLSPNLVASILADTDPITLLTVRYFEGGGSLKFTWQVLDLLGLYVQGYVLKSESSDWRVQVGGGLLWMVAPDAQIDASFDAGVTTEGAPPTAAIGATILW